MTREEAQIALANLKRYMSGGGVVDRGTNKAIDMAIKALEEPELRWIPCSERLPEYLEEVNVTWVNHDPEPYYNFVKDKPFTATAVYYKEKWYWYSSTCADLLAEYGRNPNQEIDDGIEIIAWMPLPEPYKEDPCNGCDYLGESCVGEGCGKLIERKEGEADD